MEGARRALTCHRRARPKVTRKGGGPPGGINNSLRIQPPSRDSLKAEIKEQNRGDSFNACAIIFLPPSFLSSPFYSSAFLRMEVFLLSDDLARSHFPQKRGFGVNRVSLSPPHYVQLGSGLISLRLQGDTYSTITEGPMKMVTTEPCRIGGGRRKKRK